MKIRLSTPQDIPMIMKLINEAKAYFKKQGIDQWQDGYPNEESIYQDILLKQSYLLEHHHDIIGTFCLSYALETVYEAIEEGSWLSSKPYVTLHRIAISSKEKGKNYASYILEYIYQQALSQHIHALRVDTHEDNLSMQHMLLKNGFTYCGIIYLESCKDLKHKRLAYEKDF